MRNQQYTIMSKILDSIENNQWEQESVQPNTVNFFQDSSVNTINKMWVMCVMSNQNLKFPQLENVNCNNPQELHNRLIALFGTNEENTLCVIHILACIVNRKPIDVIESLIDTRTTPGKLMVIEKIDKSGDTVLHFSCMHIVSSIDIINKFIDLGGRDLIMTTDNDGRTAFDAACAGNLSINIINILIDVGGRDLVMTTSSDGRTALYISCYINASIDIVNKLIDAGGRDLVMATDNNGCTALHGACSNSASIDIVNRLIDVGGRDLVMTTDNIGCTVLHTACYYNAPINIINKLKDAGGRGLVMTTSSNCTSYSML
jgi:ankyrin repeat protein